MNCIITLHNNKVIQGKVNVRTKFLDGKDKIILDVITRKNNYSIDFEQCKRILFKYDNNK
jgi:hypothetical protein